MSVQKLCAATAVIIRCWSNPHVAKRVVEYLNMGAGLVVVVVNATPDKGSTRAWLKDITDPRLVILDMFEGYSWVSALNRAVMSIHMANLRGKKLRFVLTASVEALFTTEHLHTMLREFADDDVGVVGTSFDARMNGNAVSIGRSYRHPRNTGMVVRLSALAATFGAFDARCDAIGGMEDIDFIVSMLVLTSFIPVMLNLKVMLIVGVNYNQEAKEQREQAAMDQIFAHWRSLFADGTHERLRIDGVIARMHLEQA